MMLLAEALVCLLRLWDNGHLQSISQHLIHDRIPVVLTQITNRTLLSQNSNGAWSANDLPEVTGYAVLTLVAISSLPWLNLLETEVAAAVNKGRRFLSQSKEQWGEARYIWVEKVTYGSTVLSQAYCLAAMNAPTPSHVWSDTMVRLIDIPSKAIAKLSHFFSVLNLPVFSNEPGWKVKASVLEGYLFLPQLKRARSDIFPHQGNAKDQYLDFIPCTWTIINNCGGIFLDTNLIWDMMEISMLDFLVDEYMESVVVQLPENELESLERIIGRLCEKPKAQTNGTKKRPYPDDNSKEFTNGSITSPTPNGIEQAHRLIEIRNVLNRYVRYILDHPRITRASISDQHTLRTELQTFLLAHLTQIRDNARFSHQDFLPSTTTTTKPFLTPRTAYYTWTHTTAAEHISCPFSFAFYACLLGSSSTSPSNSNNVRDDCFPSAVQKYLAQDLCTHLAVMSRLYNDYASIARDRAEKNLNSVNFPEFHPPSLLHTSATVTTHTTYLNDDELESKLKTAVLQLAEYERACVGMVAGRLVEGLKASGKMGKRTADAVGLFVAVTELYAEMYVVRDLTNRVK